MAEHFNIAITAWAPLAGGALTGKYLDNTSTERRLAETSERLNDRNTAIAREVVAVASEVGCTPAQVALRWVMQRPQRIIPIVGARKVAQITDCLGATEVHLSDEHISRLHAVSAIKYGFPHDFFRQDGVKEVTYSGDINKLEW
jgi:aryl-alcohol dehydrogenase-like predicted oxidoreductase